MKGPFCKASSAVGRADAWVNKNAEKPINLRVDVFWEARWLWRQLGRKGEVAGHAEGSKHPRRGRGPRKASGIRWASVPFASVSPGPVACRPEINKLDSDDGVALEGDVLKPNIATDHIVGIRQASASSCTAAP